MLLRYVLGFCFVFYEQKNFARYHDGLKVQITVSPSLSFRFLPGKPWFNGNTKYKVVWIASNKGCRRKMQVNFWELKERLAMTKKAFRERWIWLELGSGNNVFYNVEAITQTSMGNM